MRRLSKTQSAAMREHAAEIARAHEALADAIGEYNEAAARLWSQVEGAKVRLEDALQSAEEFRAEVEGEIEDYASERSEAWADSEAGQAHQDWHSAWQEEFETSVDLEEPDEIAVPDEVTFEYPEEVG